MTAAAAPGSNESAMRSGSGAAVASFGRVGSVQLPGALDGVVLSLVGLLIGLLLIGLLLITAGCGPPN